MLLQRVCFCRYSLPFCRCVGCSPLLISNIYYLIDQSILRICAFFTKRPSRPSSLELLLPRLLGVTFLVMESGSLILSRTLSSQPHPARLILPQSNVIGPDRGVLLPGPRLAPVTISPLAISPEPIVEFSLRRGGASDGNQPQRICPITQTSPAPVCQGQAGLFI